MVSITLNPFDYLVAAIDRAIARGWEAKADALGQLYQATGAALEPAAGVPGRIQAALEGIQRVDHRRAQAIRPAFEGLISGLEFELRRKEAA